MTYILLHSTACCVAILLLPVLGMIFKFASWVIFLVAPSAGSLWTNWCLQCCCKPMGNVFDVAPGNQLDAYLLTSDGDDYVSISCSCTLGKNDDNAKQWEVLRTI
jgi:hypothetical protein